MNLFLSGPMTGIAHDNRPEFSRVSGLLADMGHAVWVPPFEVPPTLPYREALGRCMEYLCYSAEGIVSLPGWSESPGARAEAAAARAIGLPHWTLVELPAPLFLPDAGEGNPAKAALGRATEAKASIAQDGWVR